MNTRCRYAVLLHSGIAEPHFDLLIEPEPGALLMTWRLPRWPAGLGDAATRIKDHRRDYLTYEGPLSDDRGDVERVDEGSCDFDGTTVMFANGFSIGTN